MFPLFHHIIWNSNCNIIINCLPNIFNFFWYMSTISATDLRKCSSAVSILLLFASNYLSIWNSMSSNCLIQLNFLRVFIMSFIPYNVINFTLSILDAICNLKMWKPWCFTTLWASTVCYWDSFIFFTFYPSDKPNNLFYYFRLCYCFLFLHVYCLLRKLTTEKQLNGSDSR
jgi:hypothetical protein